MSTVGLFLIGAAIGALLAVVIIGLIRDIVEALRNDNWVWAGSAIFVLVIIVGVALVLLDAVL